LNPTEEAHHLAIYDVGVRKIIEEGIIRFGLNNLIELLERLKAAGLLENSVSDVALALEAEFPEGGWYAPPLPVTVQQEIAGMNGNAELVGIGNPGPNDPDNPGNWYGGDGGYEDVNVLGGTAPLGGLGRAASIGALLAALTVSARATILPWLRGFGAQVGRVIPWSSIPPGIRQTLVTSGVVIVGQDLIFDDTAIDLLPEIGDILPSAGTIAGLLPFVGSPLRTGSIVKIGEDVYEVASSWRAGQAVFYRFTDGHIGVRKKTGVWKIWRPKKGVLLFRTGNNSPRDIKAAAEIVLKQLKQDIKLARGLGYEVRRKTAPARRKKGD